MESRGLSIGRGRFVLALLIVLNDGRHSSWTLWSILASLGRSEQRECTLFEVHVHFFGDRGGISELLRRVSEETDLPLASGRFVAHLGTVPR